MGCTLACVLANIFMGFYESELFDESDLNKPKFYLRYVDDILAAPEREQNSSNFLDNFLIFLNFLHSFFNFFMFLNNKRPNVKFTFRIINILN